MSRNIKKIIGIEHVTKSISDGDQLQRSLQRESFWIYALKYGS